ncbi:hypothetical protein F5887DRAFT_975429 [Amanita rubescens]|nr:hypothetical protein F5887DRAFT_975429 [Amanita rubescens]
MTTYTLSNRAYIKIFFHAAKHSQRSVNGVLLGKAEGSSVIIEDAVPLLHHWTSLSPMMEIGLDLAGQYADSQGLKLVGYYQACERLDDAALAPVGEKVAEKIKAGFDKAVAFVIDGALLGTSEPALIPYVPSGTSWKPHPESSTAFTQKSPFLLAFRRHSQSCAFGDFDDHLEDVTIDWLRNTVCMPADI